MKGKVIIDDNGSVTVPSEVRMTIAEIADLFCIFYQTAKRNIRAIEESGVADGDYSMCCTVEGSKVSPEYYGLEMVIAVAVRINSPRAKLFRNWLLNRATKTRQPIYLQCDFAGKELILN